MQKISRYSLVLDKGGKQLHLKDQDKEEKVRINAVTHAVTKMVDIKEFLKTDDYKKISDSVVNSAIADYVDRFEDVDVFVSVITHPDDLLRISVVCTGTEKEEKDFIWASFDEIKA